MNNDLFFSEKLRQQPSITTLIANSEKRKIEEAARRKKDTEMKKEAAARRREETEIKKEAAVETKLGAAVLCEEKKKQRKMKRVNIMHFFIFRIVNLTK